MPRTKNTVKKQRKTTKRGEKKEVRRVKKASSQEVKKNIKEQQEKYIEGVGRRKTSIARVRIWTKGKKEIIVNEKPYESYFPTFDLHKIVTAPLELLKLSDKFRITAKVYGGGIHSQAEAIRHGLARAIVKMNPDFRKKLKRAGFLTRDPRERERKKPGLKRARRAPQWSKR